MIKSIRRFCKTDDDILIGEETRFGQMINSMSHKLYEIADPIETVKEKSKSEDSIKELIFLGLKNEGIYEKYLMLEKEALEKNHLFVNNFIRTCELVSWCYYLKKVEDFNRLPREKQAYAPMPIVRKKPFFLLSHDEINREKRNIGLKIKGDVFVHPEREMDISDSIQYKMKSEGLLGRLCKKSSQYDGDAFYQLPNDTKTKWGRAALSMYNSLSGDSQSFDDDENKIIASMEFACRSIKIPVFTGDYSNPEFIRRRIEFYSGGIVWEEVEAILSQLEDSLSEEDSNLIEMSDSVNSSKGILEALLPTLDSLGLTSLYETLIKDKESKNLERATLNGYPLQEINDSNRLDFAIYVLKEYALKTN